MTNRSQTSAPPSPNHLFRSYIPHRRIGGRTRIHFRHESCQVVKQGLLLRQDQIVVFPVKYPDPDVISRPLENLRRSFHKTARNPQIVTAVEKKNPEIFLLGRESSHSD